MASEQHNFIVSAIARKIKLYGYRISYLDGKYQDIETERPDIPPKILNHRPDVIGIKKDAGFCIGEAKTKDDISSERTKKQITDFISIVKLDPGNKFIIGIPLIAKEDLDRLIRRLGFENQEQIEIIYIPEELLPCEEEI